MHRSCLDAGEIRHIVAALDGLGPACAFALQHLPLPPAAASQLAAELRLPAPPLLLADRADGATAGHAACEGTRQPQPSQQLPWNDVVRDPFGGSGLWSDAASQLADAWLLALRGGGNSGRDDREAAVMLHAALSPPLLPCMELLVGQPPADRSVGDSGTLPQASCGMLEQGQPPTATSDQNNASSVEGRGTKICAMGAAEAMQALAALLAAVLHPSCSHFCPPSVAAWRKQVPATPAASALAAPGVDYYSHVDLALALLDVLDHTCATAAGSGCQRRGAQQQQLPAAGTHAGSLHAEHRVASRWLVAVLVRMFAEAASRVSAPAEQRALLAAAGRLHASAAGEPDPTAGAGAAADYSASEKSAMREEPSLQGLPPSYPHLRRWLAADESLQAAASAALVSLSNRTALAAGAKRFGTLCFG